MNTRSSGIPYLQYNPEIEKFCKQNRKRARHSESDESSTESEFEELFESESGLESEVEEMADFPARLPNETDATYLQRILNQGREQERAAQEAATREREEAARARTCLDSIKP